MIKFISFDLDGTLGDMTFDRTLWDIEIPKLYAKKYNLSFKEAQKEVLERYYSYEDKDYRWFSIERWFKEFGLKSDWRKMMQDLSHHINLFPETVPVLEELSKKYKLIIISKAPNIFINMKLKISKIERFFYNTFSMTTDFKMVKKRKQAYERILKELKIKPDEMVHIGDEWGFDYLTPKKLGIRSFYLDRSGKKKGKNIVKNLEEFKEKVLKL